MTDVVLTRSQWITLTDLFKQLDMPFADNLANIINAVLKHTTTPRVCISLSDNQYIFAKNIVDFANQALSESRVGGLDSKECP